MTTLTDNERDRILMSIQDNGARRTLPLIERIIDAHCDAALRNSRTDAKEAE